ncbi:PTS glucose transporter subunit IIA [Brevibacillus brevis]|uniref:PTS sugar transporter subunit IIA n=1 Tax=Brevibacillus brevis TaxID=1393 RepID=UPI0007D8BF8F|nr:PTS glucose transporter subunit IIA [Brevibacillus brevis]
MLRGLFSRKKQQQEVTFLAPLTGTVLPLSEVPDPVFAGKVVGDGVAILPSADTLVSPVDGKVTHLFPTHHAIGLSTESGLEILMHIGIDTVKLNGKGFTPFVSVGDQVKAGDRLIQFDKSVLQDAGCPIVTPIVITNGDRVAEKNVVAKATVQAGQEPLMTVVLK